MADKSRALSIIDKDLKVEGTIRARGKLLIGGEVEGALVGDKVIAVQGSRVVAWAKVQELVIGGKFEGDVTAYRSLRILPTGNLRGNIIYRTLTLEPGGKFNGNARPLASEDEVLATEEKSSANNPSPPSRAAKGDAGGKPDAPKP